MCVTSKLDFSPEIRCAMIFFVELAVKVLKKKNVEHVRHLESAFSVCWAALYLSVSWLQTIFIQERGSLFQFGVRAVVTFQLLDG